MTLVLNLLTANRVVQASDRRLTSTNGSVVDNEANKAICVICADSVFSIGYTGLAKLGRISTDIWIVDHLTQLNAGLLPLFGIVDSIQNELKSTIDALQIDNAYKALSIIMSGFFGDKAFMLQLSNCEDENLSRLPDTDKDFHHAFITLNRNTTKKSAFAYSFHGWEPAIDRTITKRLARLHRKRFFYKSDNISVANEAVSLIRAASRHPNAANKIGRSCMSVVIPPNPMTFETRYHPDKSSPQLYGPHLITPDAAYKSIQIWTGKDPPKWWTDMIKKP